MPTCTVTSFQTAGACFKNLNESERAALKIYFNNLELTAIGGTAYTLAVDGTLLAAAVDYNRLTVDEMEVAELVIAYNNAVAAGASPSTDIQVLSEAIKCVELFGERMKAQMQLLLDCKLGRHAAQ